MEWILYIIFTFTDVPRESQEAYLTFSTEVECVLTMEKLKANPPPSETKMRIETMVCVPAAKKNGI